MRAFGNDLNEQEQAMAAFLHDTNMHSGGISRGLRCAKSLLFTLKLIKEQIDPIWEELQQIERSHLGLLRKIDIYYEKFKQDFPASK